MEKHSDEQVSFAVINFPDYGLKYMDKLFQTDVAIENAKDLYN